MYHITTMIIYSNAVHSSSVDICVVF